MKHLSWKYVAGLVDGEGCIDIQASKGNYLTPRVRIALTEPGKEVIDLLYNNFSGHVYENIPSNENWAKSYRWELTGYHRTCPMLRNIVNHLIIKKEQAKLILWMESNLKGKWLNVETRQVAIEELKAMKRDPHRLSEKAQARLLACEAIVGTVEITVQQLWSDEILAAFKQNLVIANLVSRISHNGKKGDSIVIPSPARGSASAKAAATAVTLIYGNESSITLTIDKHFEYSRLIEDIVDVQALGSLRQFYVNDAGYALATRIDRHLSLLWHYLNAGNTTPAAANLFETAVIGSDGTTTFSGSSGGGNGAALTDAGIRRMIQTLDDNDIPSSERVIIIPPVEKKNLLGIPRYTEQAFIGETGMGNSIRNGLVGEVYGMPVYVSTNCPVIHVESTTTNTQLVNFSTTSLSASTTDEYGLTVDFTGKTDTKWRVGCMMHKSALVFIEQMGVRTQTQYKQEYLADLLTADTIYGVGRLRDGGSGTNSMATAGLAFVVPS